MMKSTLAAALLLASGNALYKTEETQVGVTLGGTPVDILEDFKIITDNYAHYYGQGGDVKAARDAFVFVPQPVEQEVTSEDTGLVAPEENFEEESYGEVSEPAEIPTGAVELVSNNVEDNAGEAYDEIEPSEEVQDFIENYENSDDLEAPEEVNYDEVADQPIENTVEEVTGGDAEESND